MSGMAIVSGAAIEKNIRNRTAYILTRARKIAELLAILN